MEIIIEDDTSSSTSTSSSSQTEKRNRSKRKAGRMKLKETRHPVYRGVRLKKGSKWVSEVREPGTKNRIWLGTFPTVEMAARAYDAATLALRGDDSPLNFTDSVRLLKRAASSSVVDVKKAAFEAAFAFGPRCVDISKSCSSSGCLEVGEGSGNAVVEVAVTGFLDEEMMFNMPGFYNSMAEGLVITPPGMKKGFNWSDDIDSNFDLTLWKY